MGSVPVKVLMSNPRAVRLANSPISVGCETPVKVFMSKNRSVRLVKSPISVGSLPVKVLSDKSR